MSSQTATNQEWALAFYELQDAYTDFILSRQAKLCSKGMIKFYNFTTGKFIQWLEQGGITKPEEISARHVRAFLAELASKGLSDSYIHGYARAIKTMLRFFHAENYLSKPVVFDMPPIRNLKLPYLRAEDIPIVLNECKTKRDQALFLFMIDSGLRRAEVCDLSWGNVDIPSGLARVEKGKGGKPRSVVDQPPKYVPVVMLDLEQ